MTMQELVAALGNVQTTEPSRPQANALVAALNAANVSKTAADKGKAKRYTLDGYHTINTGAFTDKRLGALWKAAVSARDAFDDALRAAIAAKRAADGNPIPEGMVVAVSRKFGQLSYFITTASKNNSESEVI